MNCRSARPFARRRAARLGHRGEDLANGIRSLDDLAFAPDHDAAELRVIVSSLGHQRDLGVAPNVQHLLGLGVGGHIKRAVLREEIHRHDMGKPVLADRRQRALAVLAQEGGLLVGAELNLPAPVHRHPFGHIGVQRQSWRVASAAPWANASSLAQAMSG